MRAPTTRPGGAAERATQAAAALLDAPKSEDLRIADVRLLDELAKASVSHLPRFIDRVRQSCQTATLREISTQGHWRSPRSTLTDVEKRLLNETSSGPFVLMCSANGFERQRALEAVQQIPNAFCLALLLIRLNDWVKEVRGAARTALDRQSAGLRADPVSKSTSRLWIGAACARVIAVPLIDSSAPVSLGIS